MSLGGTIIAVFLHCYKPLQEGSGRSDRLLTVTKMWELFLAAKFALGCRISLSSMPCLAVRMKELFLARYGFYIYQYVRVVCEILAWEVWQNTIRNATLFPRLIFHFHFHFFAFLEDRGKWNCGWPESVSLLLSYFHFFWAFQKSYRPKTAGITWRKDKGSKNFLRSIHFDSLSWSHILSRV